MVQPGAPPNGPEHDAGRKPTDASTFDSAGLAGVGFQFVAAILIGMFGGKWLDGRIGTAPWLMIIGVFAGATAATVSMYRKLFPSGTTSSTKRSK